MRLLLTMLISALALNGFAQQYIYLQKGNDVPYKRFALYDEVKIKLEGGEAWVEGQLQEIQEKAITVSGITYPLDKIVAFRSHHELLHLGGRAMATAGVFFTGIVFVNRLVNGDAPLLKKGQIIFGAGMLAGVMLVRWLSRKTYEKEDGWHWKVINLDKDINTDAD